MITRLTIDHLDALIMYLRDQKNPELNIQNIESFIMSDSNYLLAYTDNSKIVGIALALYESLRAYASSDDDIVYTFDFKQSTLN